MPKLTDLKSGEIYKIPHKDGSGFAYVRVVLVAAQLNLVFENPLFFVSNDYLLQVSRLREHNPAAFCNENLLVNGVFIQRQGPWKKHGFEKVGEEPLSLTEVEMPCFCSSLDEGRGRVVNSFCRGEAKFPLKRDTTPDQVGCYLCMKTPGSLMTDLFIENGRMKLKEWFWRCDGRFSEQCRAFMRDSGIDLSVPYYELLASDRVAVYEKAIRPSV
jgi:hypothetical protein